jgi:hypothetical protein
LWVMLMLSVSTDPLCFAVFLYCGAAPGCISPAVCQTNRDCGAIIKNSLGHSSGHAGEESGWCSAGASDLP